jgi:hypothetical protein
MSESIDSKSRPAFQARKASHERDWSHDNDDVPSVPDTSAPSKILVG